MLLVQFGINSTRVVWKFAKSGSPMITYTYKKLMVSEIFGIGILEKLHRHYRYTAFLGYLITREKKILNAGLPKNCQFWKVETLSTVR